MRITIEPNGRRHSLGEGVELTKDSSLATLRAACSLLGVSGSGSQVKGYTKILNHNKKMGLLNAKSLVSEAKAHGTREALGQNVAKMPDEARQRLTHGPYATWCYECIEHRARPDRHERTNGVKRGSIPEVSFDFWYSRARDSETKSARAVCWLVAMNFSELLRYSAIT